MSYILVTNDDGVDSPALLPLVQALRALAPVRVVVPDGERSWIGKAISRWGEVRVDRIERDGVEIFAAGGFPADCINLGVHSLFPGPPSLVVSGVNIGLNTGLCLLLSSGTVGAAMEAWIAGIPALAFSTGLQGRDRDWKRGAATEALREAWEGAAELAADITSSVRRVGFPEGVDLLNVNFPVGSDASTPRVVSELAPVGYAALFRHRESGTYVHEFSGVLRDEESLGPCTDVTVVRSGRVSITPVQLAHSVPVDDDLRGALERTAAVRERRSPSSSDASR